MLAEEQYMKTKRVLVIEDNTIAAMTAKMVLEANGCLVDWISTGKEISNKLNQHYDLLLLDIGLPDIDGFEVAQLVRHSETSLAGVPIVILTAHAVDEQLRARTNLKINDYLIKPFTMAKCNSLLKNFIEFNVGSS